MNNSTIAHWERQGDIGILTLSNGKENYLIEPEFANLQKLKSWTNEPTLKGIIIKGAGRNFSAGASINDLFSIAKDETNLKNKISAGKEILDFIESLNIPVIASINGVCFGGGLEIALACHIRIASSNALFAFPESSLGLIPGLGGIYRITHLLRQREIHDLLLTGDMVNAEHAKDIGLIDYISPDKDSFNYSFEKINSLTHDRSAELINYVIAAIHNARKMNQKEALKIETELFCKLAIQVKKEE